MRGIVGISGREPVAPLLVEALKRLGIAAMIPLVLRRSRSGKLDRRRAEGKLINLDRKLRQEPPDGVHWHLHPLGNARHSK